MSRLTDELSSREPSWQSLLHLSLVENQLLGQVEDMEEQIIVLQTEVSGGAQEPLAAVLALSEGAARLRGGRG